MMDQRIKEKLRSKIYTCSDYREEMILAGLRKQITQTGLSERERLEIENEIHRIEKEMGF